MKRFGVKFTLYIFVLVIEQFLLSSCRTTFQQCNLGELETADQICPWVPGRVFKISTQLAGQGQQVRNLNSDIRSHAGITKIHQVGQKSTDS